MATPKKFFKRTASDPVKAQTINLVQDDLVASINSIYQSIVELQPVTGTAAAASGNFTGSYINNLLTQSFDQRYVLTSSQFTQSITSSVNVVGDISSSGQGIFNTGYKTLHIQMQLTSTQLVGTVALTGGYYGCTPPWSGSLAGFSLVAIGAQPRSGQLYGTVRLNGTPVIASTLTSSNSIVNPSITFPRGMYPFIKGQALDVNINSVSLNQSSAGGATYVGFGVAVWVYM